MDFAHEHSVVIITLPLISWLSMELTGELELEVGSHHQRCWQQEVERCQQQQLGGNERLIFHQ